MTRKAGDLDEVVLVANDHRAHSQSEEAQPERCLRN